MAHEDAPIEKPVVRRPLILGPHYAVSLGHLAFFPHTTDLARGRRMNYLHAFPSELYAVLAC
jgi:hypothetical protein